MGASRFFLVAAVTGPVVVACASLEGLGGGMGDAGTDDAKAPDPTDLLRDGSTEASARSCPVGEKLCANACTPELDPSTGCRGSCSPCTVPTNAAGALCRQGDGLCGLKCPGSRADCDKSAGNGCEVDLLDPQNCGSDCDSRSVCGGALPYCAATPGNKPACVASCPNGQAACGGSCADTSTSLTHCGACNAACVGASNLVATCERGTCTKVCADGFGDCDGNMANGCEPLVRTWDDADLDGFGGTPREMVCPNKVPTGRAKEGGDCNDTNPNVYPGQKAYFSTGYTATGGGLSYDYDCNGIEEDFAKHGDYVGCVAGYLTGVRRGGTTNPYCGSTAYLTGGSGSGSGSSSGSGTSASCASSTSVPVACR